MESDREQLIHTIGNLTLLTSRLNAKVSNGPWSSKRLAVKQHDVLKLGIDLLEADVWNDESIRRRTDVLTSSIIGIWPVPPGHRTNMASQAERPHRKIELADLIGAGLLEAGTKLYARRKAHGHRTATVLPDGYVDVDGIRYGSLFDPSKLADSAGDELSVAGYRNQTRRWDPRSDDGARRFGGRFKPPHSFPVICLCTTRPCVVAELTRQARGQNLDVEDLLPRELWCLTVELTKVLDLTNGDTLRALDLDPTTSFGKTCSALVRSARPPTSTVSRRFERPRQLAR